MNARPIPSEVNELRNTLANSYCSLDEYLKQDDLTIEQIQLMTAKLMNIVIEKAFDLNKNEDDNGGVQQTY